MITYRLTEDDVVAGNTLWRKHHGKDGVIVVSFLAAWGIAAFYLHHSAGVTQLLAFGSGLLVACVVTFGILWGGRASSKRNTLHYFRTGPAAGRGDLALEWNQQDIVFRQAEGFNTMKWSDFKYWDEDETVIVLLGTGPIFYAIPKHAFSGQQLTDIVAHIERAGITRSTRSKLLY